MSKKDQEEAKLVFRTCLECRENKLCHPFLAICEDCFHSVWVPAVPAFQEGQDE